MERNNILVAKFGGSSLADARQFKKVRDIVISDSRRRYVVPSAPGKRDSKDIKVTDLLYTCYCHTNNQEKFERLFLQIKKRYNDIIRSLKLDISLEKEFEEIKRAFINQIGEAYAASRGEYLNGILLAHYLGFDFVDASEVIRFEENGAFNDEETNILLKQRLSRVDNAVVPGFYGATASGKIYTFSRGGSDITGALVARAVGALKYENWTDVPGFLITDPSIVRKPKKIDIMTFAELRELSYRGASVLHEDAVYPARREGIPIHIRNTNDPNGSGTLICQDVDPKDIGPITGIAGKRNFVAINFAKNNMNSQAKYYKRLLDVLDRFNINSEHMPSGIDTISIILPRAEYLFQKDALLLAIDDALHPDSISIDDDMAMVTVVGKGMRSVSGIATKFFSALGDADVNIKMIDMGSNEMNCSIGISNADFEKAIKALYNRLAK